ncbi:MAG: sigma-70 family RNA polymerase sigma factor [Actinobacteria bacterium]|nr:MAG: sigma-70 family RNA polymerase sigma factor [Actinomycetota bacterium]
MLRVLRAGASASGAAVYRLEIDSRALSINERRLVGLAQAGDRLAFEELVRIHAVRLYGVVRQLCAGPQEAEEVTQEAFFRAWRAIGRFDGRSQLFTWLYRIGVNEAKRRAQRDERGLRTVSLEESPREPQDLSAAPEPRAERVEARAALERAVRALPLDYRAPLVLRDIEGLSTSEAAEILGVSEAALKSRLHRARAAVRDALGDQEGLGR